MVSNNVSLPGQVVDEHVWGRSVRMQFMRVNRGIGDITRAEY